MGTASLDQRCRAGTSGARTRGEIVMTPVTEAVLGTPLQMREAGGEIVVEIRDHHGRRVELKRFSQSLSQS